MALDLARYAATRDRRLRDDLVAHYDPLAVRLARRFTSRREDREDLIQVARIGLIHAVDRFDPGRQRPFEAFAQATIAGELKRHIRDHTWRMRLTRRLQEQFLVVMRARDDLTQELRRSPLISEVAARTGLTPDEVVEAMDVARSVPVASLDDPVTAGDSLRLSADDAGFHGVELVHTIRRAVAVLPERDQHAVWLRFEQGLSQAEIAARLGLSQMSISRMLARSCIRLRASLLKKDSEHLFSTA